MARLSIIIPAYNCESTLPRTLDSLLRTDTSKIEVIVVNDGSEDRTADVAQRYMSAFPKFRLINEENRGLSGARNTGFTAASGEWVMFLDGDDWLLEDGLNSALKETKSEYDIVLFPFVHSNSPQKLRESNTTIDAASGWENITVKASVLRNMMLGHETNCDAEDTTRINICNINSSCSRIMRKSFLSNVFDSIDNHGNVELFYESVSSMGEDRFFNIKLWTALGDRNVVFSSRALYFYDVGLDKNIGKHLNPNVLDHLKPRFEVIQNKMQGNCLSPQEAADLFTKDIWEYFYSTSLLQSERKDVKKRWELLLNEEGWKNYFRILPGQPTKAKMNSIIVGWMIRHNLISPALTIDNFLLRMLSN